MNFAKRMLMFVGFVVLAAALVSALAPKATRALVATLVQVANTRTNPVPNSDADNPGRATLVAPHCLANSVGGSLNCTPDYTVPLTDRLVIQQLEASCTTPSGQFVTSAQVQVSTNGNQLDHQLPLLNEGPYYDTTVFANDLAVHFYADPGSTVSFFGYTNDTAQCQFQFTGYLISYP